MCRANMWPLSLELALSCAPASLHGPTLTNALFLSASVESGGARADCRSHGGLWVVGERRWAKPTFSGRDITVNADGTWTVASIWSFCLDPHAMKIVAFAVPIGYNNDVLTDGRQCCSHGDVTCLPPFEDGHPHHIVNRGAADPYFFFDGYLWTKKR